MLFAINEAHFKDLFSLSLKQLALASSAAIFVLAHEHVFGFRVVVFDHLAVYNVIIPLPLSNRSI